jgi:hypothetical protein
MEFLRRLRDALRRKWPEVRTAGMWLLHHDNSSAHTALPVTEFLAKHPVPVLPQPPSRLTSPLPSFAFRKLKVTLIGRRFQTVEDIFKNARMSRKRYNKQPLNSACRSVKCGQSGALLREGIIWRGYLSCKFWCVVLIDEFRKLFEQTSYVQFFFKR